MSTWKLTLRLQFLHWFETRIPFGLIYWILPRKVRNMYRLVEEEELLRSARLRLVLIDDTSMAQVISDLEASISERNTEFGSSDSRLYAYIRLTLFGTLI